MGVIIKTRSSFIKDYNLLQQNHIHSGSYNIKTG